MLFKFFIYRSTPNPEVFFFLWSKAGVAPSVEKDTRRPAKVTFAPEQSLSEL
jgi:hypothetical protein